jgi:hypothetical protein
MTAIDNSFADARAFYLRYSHGTVLSFYMADQYASKKEAIMEMKKVLAGWSKICPG